jgi:biotin-(acetyl-CoA carboxylase) ligase
VIDAGGAGKAYPYGRALSPEVLDALNRRDVLSDQRVDSEQEGPGIARGILESGALLLERDDGSRVGVVAGNVRLA